MVCAAIHTHVTAAHPARHIQRCAGNMTPYVYVDGQQLTIADLSHHGSVATFYGEGSVIRLSQRGNIVSMRAVTVLAGARVVIRFRENLPGPIAH